LVSLLGAIFRGILCSDRYSVYGKYHQGRKQFCWAHLKRAPLALLDQKHVEDLAAAGWQSMIVWECETWEEDSLKKHVTAFLGRAACGEYRTAR
jgi:G:T-mismatch repair DNA endonuclease (very short patch repair protein)